MSPTANAFQLEFSSGPSLVNVSSAIPVGFSPNGNVANANIVFAGYGIVSKDPAFDDYGDNDVRGKVVMVLDGTPDNDNPHTPFYRFDARTKAADRQGQRSGRPAADISRGERLRTTS